MAKHFRDPQREAFWREVLKRHAVSGMSVRRFCQREKLTESTFFAWRRTIAERDAEVKSRTGRGGRPKRLKQPAFLPVVIDEEQGRNGSIMIELAGGRLLRLPESIATERLVQLVNSLEARGAASEAAR
jgi:transposase